VLVNNAATYVPFLIADATDEQLRRTIDGSLMSALYCIRAAIRSMQPRGTGDILSVTSESVRYPAPMLSIYAAAKAGITTVHEALRRELTGTGIRTMVFETGRIDSSSTGENWAPGQLEEFSRRWVELGYHGPLAMHAVTAKTLAATIAHMVDAPREATIGHVQMQSTD
jgi:NADP-dependent 3-hydroxy acid dehydrogenase YdfG